MWIPFGRPGAIARIAGGHRAPTLYGSVKFYQLSDAVLVAVDVTGLPRTEKGVFGLHIHEGGNCSGTDFVNTGAHYDTQKNEHPCHAGDLPPLFSCNGRAYMEVQTCRFRLKEILGKTVVIHGEPDDFRTQPAGNAGPKIACGIIEVP